MLDAYAKGLLHQNNPLQDYVSNLLAGLDALKIANMICEYHTLVVLVEEMRIKQKALENAPNTNRYENEAIATLVDEVLDLEKKVDRLLENIKNGKY